MAGWYNRKSVGLRVLLYPGRTSVSLDRDALHRAATQCMRNTFKRHWFARAHRYVRLMDTVSYIILPVWTGRSRPFQGRAMEARLISLIDEAMARHGLRIFENIDKNRLARLALASRGKIIGHAVMERGGREGYILGREILALSSAA